MSFRFAMTRLSSKNIKVTSAELTRSSERLLYDPSRPATRLLSLTRKTHYGAYLAGLHIGAIRCYTLRFPMIPITVSYFRKFRRATGGNDKAATFYSIGIIATSSCWEWLGGFLVAAGITLFAAKSMVIC